jgi:hypothetical protein
MSYSNYSEYLAHPMFLASVATARTRSRGNCEQCGTSEQTEPHHVRYCPWGEFDPPENLLMLCRVCHEDAHTCRKCGRIALKAREIKLGRDVCLRCEHSPN